jgi:U3 small nucleolar RNA-associated protein 10
MLPALTLLAEIISSNTLPGSIELISRLLETLNTVVQYVSPTRGDLSFLEQLLMSAVDNVADKVSVSIVLAYQASGFENGQL